MKKEVILAILIGLGMGLFITYGVYRVKSSIATPQVTDLEQATDASPTTTATPALIAIHNPEHGKVQSESTITVTGTTTENAYVVLFVNDDDSISTSDDTGNFSFEVDLEDGVNYITVHVVKNDGTTATDERIVIVSDALDTLENPEATESAETTTDTTVEEQ
ncbi:MAG: hypothetical protein GW762_01580 [Candidatus Pacebacteria bacterium]|nr:hypothetical protein [Candidatus Paceibacterota bacterium]PIR63366.1 MAG: hypothetical protein COU64_04795 [Candidatus Pacebacteria bacterium CG10_big_fil_rev_8_21_14_0_10_40_26]PIZ79114.1 MAG: hypothetical protein COY01_01665 [Candidatus Pacebacteria bacterium CG_4_10_14_0_2_um_filter_40_20]PJA69198.1 MAG: hypothetical protein CO156_01170 [Candidatus Pacebacteria bacterium CG_4_9_14_3_um_filter_40_12]PJC42080.1 MAG: hypothetical protein CO041_00375 [Candidatus Pacebacteria bacterium CG_4_9_